MPEYRVFVRDLDNHILSAGFTFFCESDQEALEKTEKPMHGSILSCTKEASTVARIRCRVTSRKPTLWH